MLICLRRQLALSTDTNIDHEVHKGIHLLQIFELIMIALYFCVASLASLIQQFRWFLSLFRFGSSLVQIQPPLALTWVQIPAVPIPVQPDPNGDFDDADDDPAGNVGNVTPRRNRRSELELLTGGIRTPALDRSLRSRQQPERLTFDHSTPRHVVKRKHNCRDCKIRLNNLFKNANLI